METRLAKWTFLFHFFHILFAEVGTVSGTSLLVGAHCCAKRTIDSLSGSNHNKQNSVVLNLDGSNVVKTFSQNNDFCNQLNANGPVCVACGVLECMCVCLDTVQSGANFAM